GRKANGASRFCAVPRNLIQVVAARFRNVERGKEASRDASFATEEAVRDAREDPGGNKGGGHAKPAGSSPGLWAQRTLNSVPIWSSATSRSTPARTLSAWSGLALAR